MHHIRDPVTGRCIVCAKYNVVHDMASQDKRPAWNQAKKPTHGFHPPPPKPISRPASPKDSDPSQPKIIYVQGPPSQFPSEPNFVLQELPRPKSNLTHSQPNEQPKVVYVQAPTTPRQPTIILQNHHRPRANPTDHTPTEQPQIVYIQAPQASQPPAPSPRQPTIILQELPRPHADKIPHHEPRVVYVAPKPHPSQTAHPSKKPKPKPLERTHTVYYVQTPPQAPPQQHPQKQQPIITYQTRSPPPSYQQRTPAPMENNEGVVGNKYPDYKYRTQIQGQKNVRRRQCLTAVIVAAILLALLALILGLYFGITKSLVNAKRNAPQNRIAGGYKTGYYVNGIYVVPVTSKPSNLYLIFGADTPCNGPGATQPNLPNCADVTTAIVLANWTTTTITTPSQVIVLELGAEKTTSTVTLCLLGLLLFLLGTFFI